MNSRRRRFNRTLRIGLMFLAGASVAKFVLEHHGAMPEGPRDGLVGLLYGVAIGAMLLGLWRAKGSTCKRSGRAAS